MKSFIARLVPITLATVQREEPNVLENAYEQHPVFYGCLDWHSAVHSHWQLVRVLRRFPDAAFAPEVESLLEEHLGNYGKLQVEILTMLRQPKYEVPYGLAWMLQLCAELRDWGEHGDWLENLSPLESYSAESLLAYFGKLAHPIRSGLHRNSAFALGLAYDWAKIADDVDLILLTQDLCETWFIKNSAAPFDYEPSATDFLSPLLAQADLVRRVLDQPAFENWFADFLPDPTKLPKSVTVVDPSDGQLAHFAGLNLSRAWMMRRIAWALSAGERRAALLKSAESHMLAGLKTALSDEYMISHWVPSFAVYLLTLE